jgi:hypothetical protein
VPPNGSRLKPITAHAGQVLFQLIIDPIPHGLKGKTNAAGPAAKMDRFSGARQLKFTIALRTLHRFRLSSVGIASL